MPLRLVRRRLAPPAVLSLALLAAACTLPPPGPGGSQPGIGPAALRPIPAPDGKGRPPPNSGELAADPSRFKGLAASEVVAKLGDPSFRRREAPAEIWQYYGPGCVLDLFLYDEKGVQKVAHFELRNHALQADGGANCLAELLRGIRGGNNS